VQNSDHIPFRVGVIKKDKLEGAFKGKIDDKTFVETKCLRVMMGKVTSVTRVFGLSSDKFVQNSALYTLQLYCQHRTDNVLIT
jgi:hypothetical protein